MLLGKIGHHQMYYHVLIETKENKGKTNSPKRYYELDKTNLLEIEEDIVLPYLNEEEFQFDGYFLNSSDISRVVVKESERTTQEYSDYENANMGSGIVMYVSPSDILSYDNHVTDITKSIFKNCKKKSNSVQKENKKSNQVEPDLSKVFIVHGHDELAKTDTARFIEKLGLKAIILHEQASSGNTIIEKIEEYSNVGFGIILYTPCDVGSKMGAEKTALKSRARQNVVFEHGYLIGKLGRRNVCALVKENVELPNDISGVVYVQMDSHKAWHIALAKELRNAGYQIDMNLVI
ncbi:MAG: nucleotide-binding protein [Marinoscillum sp.]